MLFEGATVLFDDDRLYLHMLEAHRVSPLTGSTALIIYAVVFALLLLSLIGFGIFRLIRRVRVAIANQLSPHIAVRSSSRTASE